MNFNGLRELVLDFQAPVWKNIQSQTLPVQFLTFMSSIVNGPSNIMIIPKITLQSVTTSFIFSNFYTSP